MAWALEHVSTTNIEQLRLSFLVVGHTKFDVDRVFSTTAKAYASEDVFTTEELANIMSQSDNISSIVDNGRLVRPWREKLPVKYTKLPGIRAMHDFYSVHDKSTSKCEMMVRDQCYDGSTRKASIRVKEVGALSFRADENYISTRSLTSTKLSNLRQMYTNFVPSERWPPFL